MALHSTAQGLASLGRHGDSLLVHMQPQEVAGLQSLAQSQGTSLTINPNTGLPEAFNLGNFFTSLLPTLAGFMVGGPAGASLGLKAGTTAATLAPIAAGVATGAAVAGAKGDNVLTGGLMGGLGGYGGGSMGSAYSAATNPGITNTLSGNIGDSLVTQADDLASTTALNSVLGGKAGIDPNILGVSTSGTKLPGVGININPQTVPGDVLSMSKLTKGIVPDAIPGLAETRGALPSFTPQAAGGTSSMMDTAGRFVQNLGGTGPAALSLGAPTLMAGYEAGMFTPKTDTSLEEKRKAEENKYRDPRTGLLNLTQASPDFGTMFMALGGSVNLNPSEGGGISDLYNRPEGATTQSISSDGYGMGRLDRLAQEESLNHAKTLGYDMGGPVAFAKGGHQGYLDGEGDGMSDSIPATIEGKQPARLADGEFVVPADVVSHLGNGSSKAGSKRLYAMLDKVRHARTGNKKQGRQINPAKYMPA